MSPPGRPKGELRPPWGQCSGAAANVGVPMSPPGRPKGDCPPGGAARSAVRGEPTNSPGRPEGELRPLGGSAAAQPQTWGYK